MKNAVRITAVAIVVVMLCLCFASCAKTLSGKYISETDVAGVAGSTTVYNFSGNKVTITTKSEVFGSSTTTTKEGTYEIIESDAGMEIKFSFEDEEGNVKVDKYDFEETEEGIKIGVVEYKKEK